MNHDWRSFGIVAAVAVVARGGATAAALLGIGPFDQLGEDPDAYRRIAETLSASGTFGITAEGGAVDPTAFRPPLYPWLLSWLVVGGRLGDPAVALLHAAIGILTCLGVFAAVRQLIFEPQGGNRTAVIAGCLTALDPLLLMQSTLVMTETLAAGLAVAAWWAANRGWTAASADRSPRTWGATTAWGGTRDGGGTITRGGAKAWGWWFAVGGLLAAGYLCRPVFAAWTALWLGWLALRVWLSPEQRRPTASQAIGICLAVAIAIGGWTLRNQRVIGHAVWATTHGGYTLLLGNNPHFYEYLDSRSFAQAAFWGEAWDAEAFHQEWAEHLSDLRLTAAGQGQDAELIVDRVAGEMAKETIRERPAMFMYASLVRIGRLWSPIPRVGNRVGPVSWAVGAFYAALGIGAMIGLWGLWNQLGSPGWAPPLLLILALTAVHAVYWSNLRMRAPVMPMVAALAAVGFLGRGSKWGEQRSQGNQG